MKLINTIVGVTVLVNAQGRSSSNNGKGESKPAARVRNVGTYPGYTGDTDITGSAHLKFVNNSVTIKYNLDGVESECAQPGPAANSCGVHIHSGFTCDDASLVGGHYYSDLEVDPWSSVVYTSDGATAKGEVTVDYGATWEEADGRVLVVHGYDGGRVTCAVLDIEQRPPRSNSGKGESKPAARVRDVGTYPGYTGDTDITGSAHLKFVDNSVTIKYNLDGVESECAQPGPAANSCGVHIHSGFTCDDASLVGGHYYSDLEVDPWSSVVYTSDGATAKGEVTVDYGATWEEADGRVLVVHGYDGGRVTCAVMDIERGQQSNNAGKGGSNRNGRPNGNRPIHRLLKQLSGY